MIFSTLIAIANVGQENVSSHVPKGRLTFERSQYAIYMATIDYMVAAYGPYSASATGGNALARDFLAGIAALYATPRKSCAAQSFVKRSPNPGPSKPHHSVFQCGEHAA